MRRAAIFTGIGMVVGLVIMYLLMGRYILENEQGLGVYKMDRFTGEMWFCKSSYKYEGADCSPTF